MPDCQLTWNDVGLLNKGGCVTEHVPDTASSPLATCNFPALPLNAYYISVSLHTTFIIYDGRLAAAAQHRSLHHPRHQHRPALLVVSPARITFAAPMQSFLPVYSEELVLLV